MSPANRMLTEKYGWQGAFLLKAGFILNGCVCGAVMRPVPIEPSEILKRNKILAKKTENKQQQQQKVQMTNQEKLPPPKIYITESNDQKPNRIEKNVYSQDHINSNGLDEYDPLAFAKSLPVMTNELTTFTNSRLRLNINHKKSQLSIKNATSMDILAHTRSLQTVHVNTEQTEVQVSDINNSNNESEPKNLVNKLKQYIDLTIFTDIIFIFFAISNFLTSLGFNTPYIYIVDQATRLKIDPNLADWLLSTIGISNTVGRITLGLIADLKGVNRLYLYATVITICGLATIVEPFLTNFVGLFIYSIIFGFTSGIIINY